MKRLVLALALLAPALPAYAATLSDAGAWCAIDSDQEGLMKFKPGKCTRDENDSGSPTMILKPNGDYRLTGVGDETVCKITNKYERRGATFHCVTYGAREYRKDRVQQFMFDNTTGQLLVTGAN